MKMKFLTFSVPENFGFQFRVILIVSKCYGILDRCSRSSDHNDQCRNLCLPSVYSAVGLFVIDTASE